MSARRALLLAELGLTRYRLRSTPAGLAPTASATAVSVDPTPMPVSTATPPTDRDGVPHGISRAAPLLSVCLADGAGAPVTGAAAAIWRQVLVWLQLRDDQVVWSSPADAGAISLPDPASWSGPEGKRALWQALKAFAAERGSR